MPEKKTIEKAKRDLKQGKSASTAAGEFVHEEIEHIRHGKHGARSAKQAIAIGLSKARRAGVPLSPPKRGTTSESTRRSAARDVEIGQGARPRRPSTKRRRATTQALKREPRAAASKQALSRQAKSAARRRSSTKAASTTARRGSTTSTRGSTTSTRGSTTSRGSTTRRPNRSKPTSRSRPQPSHA